MTLIAGMGSPAGGILIADMMVSARTPSPKSLTFPTMNVEAEEKTDEKPYYIKKLESKLSLLSRYVAIAYAGDVLVGKNIIRYIGKRLPEGPQDPKSFAAFLNSVLGEYREQDRAEVDLLCLCVCTTGLVLFCIGNYEFYDKDELGTRIAAAGSGAIKFLEQIGTSGDIEALQLFPNPQSPHPHNILTACRNSITSFVNGHRWHESMTGSPADELFGGWYEIATSKASGEELWLERVEEAAFIFAGVMMEDGELIVRISPYVFFQSYSENKLLVVRGHTSPDCVVPAGEALHLHETVINAPPSDGTISGPNVQIVASQIHLTYILYTDEPTPRHATLVLPCAGEMLAHCNGREFEVSVPANMMSRVRAAWTKT